MPKWGACCLLQQFQCHPWGQPLAELTASHHVCSSKQLVLPGRTLQTGAASSCCLPAAHITAPLSLLADHIPHTPRAVPASIRRQPQTRAHRAAQHSAWMFWCLPRQTLQLRQHHKHQKAWHREHYETI